MNEERLPDTPSGADAQSKTGESSGEYLFRVLKPAGCIFVLVLAAAMLVFCFTYRSDPVADYAPAHDAGYYESDPSALAAELEAALLPFFPGAECAEENGRLKISAPAGTLESLRDTLLRHFDPELFEFIKQE